MDVDLKDRFVTIKIDRQIYLGKAVFVILIREVTWQIQVNLLSLQRQEQYLKQQQAENFTSMISHEMRAPLLSMIYFLEQIMSILIASRPARESLAQAKHFNDIMMSQFSFIDSFIEDLINLRQMCNGDFRLENS